MLTTVSANISYTTAEIMPSTDNGQEDTVQLLLPHIALASACLVFLAFNFWYYRRNNYERYKRKVEKLAHDVMSLAPRRVTSMMRYSDPKVTVVFNVTSDYKLCIVEKESVNCRERSKYIGSGQEVDNNSQRDLPVLGERELSPTMEMGTPNGIFSKSTASCKKKTLPSL